MQLYLETRGLQTDYNVPGYTGERWWLRYAQWTNLERPGVLVESDHTRWRLYLGGVKTSRKDHVGTQIRCGILADGPCQADSVDGVLGLVAAWLDAARDHAAEAALRAQLDGAFSGQTIEGALAGDAAAIGDLSQQLQRLAAGSKAAGRISARGELRAGAWASGADDPQSRADFLAAVHSAILQGQTQVLQLRYADISSVRPLLQPGTDQFFLLEGTQQPHPLAAPMLPEKKNTTEASPSQQPRPTTGVVTAVVIAVLTGLMAAALSL